MAGKASVDILYTSTFLEWETWSPLPIYVSDATVVCLNGTVYVGGGLTIGTLRDSARLYSFRPGDSLFSRTVTDTPTYRYGLTVHDSQLLLVGGREYPSGKITNKIFTLMDGEFVETLPPMREKRSIPCAVSTKSSLIVAGGCGPSGMVLSSVELFENGQWITAPSLPTAECDMKSVFNGNRWYLIQKDRKVFYTSLPFKSGQSSWEPLPNVPNRDSSAAFFDGHLLSIGGGEFGEPESSIFAFSPSSQSWEHVADLPEPLKHSACAVLPSGNLIVIGGEIAGFNYNNQVHCATVKGLEKYMRGSLNELPEPSQQAGAIEEEDLSSSKEEDNETVEEAILRLNHVVAKHMNTIGQLRKKNDILRAGNYLLGAGREESVPFNQALIKKEPASDITADYQSPISTLKQTKQEIRDLPGVEVVGRTFVMVTNSAQSFFWSDYGLKLHIPQGSLPADTNQCVLYIAVSLVGQYQLPDSKQLVSAVYWVCPNPPCRFQRQLTIEIQHCGQVNTVTKFSFVQASSQDLSHSEYMFYEMENPSSFSEHSSFGSMKLDHFCGVGVAAEGSVEKKYCSNFYYLGEEPNSKKIHFVVMRNLAVYTTMVNDYYALCNAVKEDPQQVAFQSDSITLDIPKKGVLSTVKGWKIEPLMHPAVLKSAVDSHVPGENSVFPYCQLCADYSGRKKRVPKLIHTINMIGAKEPFTYFHIKLDPYAKSSARVHSTSSGQERVVLAPLTTTNLDPSDNDNGVGDNVPTGTTGLNPVASVPPSLSELLEHVGINKDLLDQECSTDQLNRIAIHLPNWQKYAEALRLSEAQILHIKSDHQLDAVMKAQRVMSLWKEANSFKATYTVLIQVCFQLENVELAKFICNIVKNLKDLSSNHFPRPPPTGSEKRRQENDKHNEEEQLEVPPKRLRSEVSR